MSNVECETLPGAMLEGCFRSEKMIHYHGLPNVGPHAIRLASQLESAAYSHGYEDGHPSNATTRQDKYSAASQRLLSELREAVELLIAERDQARARVDAAVSAAVAAERALWVECATNLLDAVVTCIDIAPGCAIDYWVKDARRLLGPNAELTGAPLGAPGARRPVARPVE